MSPLLAACGCQGRWHALQERENEELLIRMAEDLEAQWGRTLGPYMRVAVLCGGPGLKRGATMDHARTVVAQLDTLARFGDGAALALIPPPMPPSLCRM